MSEPTYAALLREVYGTRAQLERERPHHQPTPHPWTGTRPRCRDCGGVLTRKQGGKWACVACLSTPLSPTVERRP